AAAQRLRWEHGRRQLRRMFSRQIWENSWGWSKKALAFSDLYMPALAAYFARLLAVLGTACGLVFLAKGTLLSEILLGLSLIQLLNFIIYLYMPFILVGLPASYLKIFAFGPIYVLWKASLLVRRAPAAWIRTVRKPKV
ncbi:MAG: hypothetical protein NTX25_19075, partial [Proteobacteria bacterium]|nr:hypothetical protein [Pseudomonadota bacterium]